MAQINLTVRLETDPLQDVLAELIVINDKLFTRHGERFRVIQRRIAGIGELRTDDITIHTLEPGVFIASAPPAFIALLADARAVLAS